MKLLLLRIESKMKKETKKNREQKKPQAGNFNKFSHAFSQRKFLCYKSFDCFE